MSHNTESILDIVAPISDVFGTITISENSMTIGHVIDKVTNIVIAIDMNESADSIGLIMLPVALILGAVLPHLDAFALSQSTLRPLAMVKGTVFQLKRAPVNQLPIHFQVEVGERSQFVFSVFAGCALDCRHLPDLFRVFAHSKVDSV